MEIGRERFAAIMAAPRGGGESAGNDGKSSGDASSDGSKGPGSSEAASDEKAEAEQEKKAEEAKPKEVPVKVEEAKPAPAEPAQGTDGAAKDDTKWKDMLSEVASEYGMSVEELARMNGLKDVSLAYSESSLMLPDGSFVTRNGVVGRG